MNTAQPIIMPITGEIVQEIADLENEDILLKAPFTSSFDPVIGVGNGTHTRTGTAVGIDTDGKYYIAAADQARVNGNTGYFSGPQVTNKCACYSIPNEPVGTKSYHNGTGFVQNIAGMTLDGDAAAELEIVTDQTDIEAAGLDRLNPSWKVYKLDNSGDTYTGYVDVSSVTGNTNNHIARVYVRGDGGYIEATSAPPGFPGDQSSSFVASTHYTRLSESLTPTNSSSYFRIVVNPSEIIYFLIPELLEGGAEIANMPPIICYGVATTVYPDEGSVVSAGNIDGDEGWLECNLTSSVDGADVTFNQGIFGDISSNRLLYMSGVTPTVQAYNGVTIARANSSTPLIANITHDIIVRWSVANDYLQIIQDGVAGTAVSFTTGFTLLATLEILKNPITGMSIKDLNIYSNLITEAEAIARQS